MSWFGGKLLSMILEIRTYRLKPGTGAEFIRVMREESVPLLNKHSIDVVDCGGSSVAENGHEEAYIIRSFASLQAHSEQEEAFYTSQDWLEGPRHAIASRIESYHTIVIDTSPAAIQALRR